MALKKDRIQLYHAAANTAPWWQPCPTIVTIHDVLLSRMDDDETANYLFYWRKILPLCLTKASKIITVSEFSRLDLIDAFGVPPEKVQTIHSGRDTYFHQLPPKEMNELRVRYGIPKRFIFALGAQAPRKNTLRVLESFRLLRQAAKTDCALVISGLQPGMQEQLRAAVRDDPLARDIILLGFIEREHLRFLYNEAAVFLYPSLYEGFGFPLLEAMACGTPVASSDRSSLPEIADDAALFFDPENVEAMTESLCHILNDTETAELLRSKGLERCTHFDWTRSARETLGVYEEVLGSRGSGSLII
jgi:glycosyltransferase involved in cell wall biosynthesis